MRIRRCGEKESVQTSENCTDLLSHDYLETEAQRTPTPWHEAEGARDSDVNYINGPKGQFICEIEISHPESKANAAFICRAVNAHEELLQIVKDLRHRSFDSDFKGWDKKQLDAIIAKAEEK